MKNAIHNGVLCLGLWLLSASAQALPDSNFKDSVWIGASDGLIKADGSTGAPVARNATVSGASAVRIDERLGMVWSYTQGELHITDIAGTTIKRIVVPNGDATSMVPELRPSGDYASPFCNATVPLSPELLPTATVQLAKIAIDPNDGSAWLAISNRIYRARLDGAAVLVRTLPQVVTGIAIEARRHKVWIGQCREVRGYDIGDGGTEYQAINLGGTTSVVKDIDFDDAAESLWVLQRVHIRRYRVDPVQEMAYQSLAASADDSYLRVAANGRGEAWISNQAGGLRLIRANGTNGAGLNLFAGSLSRAVTGLAANRRDGSVWAASVSAVVHVTRESVIVANRTIQQLGGGTNASILALGNYADTIPPQLDFLEPISAPPVGSPLPLGLAFTDIGIGTNDSTIALKVDGVGVARQCSISELGSTCTVNVPLADGSHALSASVADYVGNVSAPAQATVFVDRKAPAAPDTNLIVIGSSIGGSVEVLGGPGAAEPGAAIRIKNLRTGHVTTVYALVDGSFSADVMGVAGDEFEIIVEDGAQNRSDPRTLAAPPVLPADPATLAPPLSIFELTEFADSISFLYLGPNALQTGVVPGVIQDLRAAAIRGAVANRAGLPIPGVSITVAGHPEYGSTLSRADGRFDFVVNGGEPLTLAFDRDGFLQVQRRVNPERRQFVGLEKVVLTTLDSAVTVISANSTTVQVAKSSVVNDEIGSRQAVALIQSGTSAQMKLPDGTQLPLSQLSIRATEYTVGPNGPQAMPGSLPPTSAYTYAIEMTVDEALTAGADTVTFNKPVFFYVDGFLAVPVGTVVPVGWYDKKDGVWVPSDNGRVIKLLSVTGTMANLDVSGSGATATTAELSVLGITDEERIKLASLYVPGKIFWRMSMDHFTAYDGNFSYSYPPDATAPPPNQSEGEEGEFDPDEDAVCTGCEIDAQNRSVSENIPLTGTPYNLVYRSDRVSGAGSPETKLVLSGPTIPASLRRIELKAEIAGREWTWEYAPSVNLTHTFTWDGKDVFGRSVIGDAPASFSISYLYDLAYYTSKVEERRIFGAVLGAGGTPVVRWSESGFPYIGIQREVRRTLRAYSPNGSAHPVSSIGGWSLSARHHYDAAQRRLERGDGGRDVADAFNYQLQKRIPGVITGLVTLPDGSILFAESQHRIRRLRPDGVVVPYSGGAYGASYCGDGGPAINACFYSPRGLASGPDGSIYIADTVNQLIRRIRPDGIITRFAGKRFEIGFTGSPMGDGGPAVDAKLYYPIDVAVGADNSVYIAESRNRIRRVSPDGRIETFAGFGTSIPLQSVVSIEIDASGALFVADSGLRQVKKILPDGSVQVVAGSGASGYSGDGGPAIEAALDPRAIHVTRDGSSFHVADGSGRVRYVDAAGIIKTVAGGGITSVTGAGTAPAAGFLGSILALEEDPTGALEIAAIPDGTAFAGLFALRPNLPGYSADQLLLPSKDGSELYRFTSNGQHTETISSATGVTARTIAYSDGRVSQVVDDQRATTFTWSSGSGDVTSPDGLHTQLTFNSDGYLSRVTDPTGATYEIEYHPGGLLKKYRQPAGTLTEYTFDASNHLETTKVDGVLEWTIAGTGIAPGANTIRMQDVTLESGFGRVFTFHTELPSLTRSDTNTKPDGTTDNTDRYYSLGLVERLAPDGTSFSMEIGPDPRFGMGAPIATSTHIVTPGARHMSLGRTRTFSATDPLDPIFSIASITDTYVLNGKTASVVFDRANNLITQETPEGRRIITSIDAQGRPLSTAIGTLLPLKRAYDAGGRLTRLSQGEGLEERAINFDYLANGFLDSMTDALGGVIDIVRHDLNGRPLEMVLQDGSPVAVQYNEEGRIRTITTPNMDSYTQTYGPAGRELRFTPPGGLPWSESSYSPDGDIKRIHRGDGSQIELEYNAAGKKLSRVAWEGGGFDLQYSPVTGKLSSLIRGPSTLVLEFDGPLLVSETYSGDHSGSVEWSYNDDFKIQGLKVNGAEVTYNYDADGLVIGAGALSITRDPQTGYVSETTLGGIRSLYTYSPFGDLLTARYYDATNNLLYEELNTTRDKASRVIDRVEKIGGVQTAFHFTYDLRGRLTSVTKNGWSLENYSYDAGGNRLGANGVEAIYQAGDILSSYGPLSIQSDQNGAITRIVTGATATILRYDPFGNLEGLTLPDGRDVVYGLDARGRRISKSINGVKQVGFLYGDQLEPVAELYPDGTVRSRFVYGSRRSVPEYMVSNGQTYRFICDEAGNVRLVVNTSSGSIEQALTYDAYGRITTDTNPGFQPFGFAGGLVDIDSGLVLFGARTYAPMFGRWTSPDPVRFDASGWNLYAYALGNPVTNVDPTGLDTYTVHAGLSVPFLGGIEVGVLYSTSAENGYPDIGVFTTFQKNYGGLGRFKETLGVSQTLGERCNFDGTDAELHGGLGGFGGSVGGLGHGSQPESLSFDVGPQLGIGADLTQTFSLTVGDVGRGLAALIYGPGGW